MTSKGRPTVASNSEIRSVPLEPNRRPKSPAELEADIEVTRVRLAGTIDAIADRVAPANVAGGPRAAARPVRRAGRRPSDAAGCPRRCWRGADRRPGRVAAHPVSPPRGVQRVVPGPGQESVWDYPRPPRVEPSSAHVVVELGGRIIADTRNALRVLETSHPPVFYVPYADIADGVLEETPRSSYCEFKGEARYYHVSSGDRRSGRLALPHATSVVPRHCRSRRLLSRPDGPLPRRRRGGEPASGRLLRRLDHVLGRRSLQGRARHSRLVSRDLRGSTVGLSGSNTPAAGLGW